MFPSYGWYVYVLNIDLLVVNNTKYKQLFSVNGSKSCIFEVYCIDNDENAYAYSQAQNHTYITSHATTHTRISNLDDITNSKVAHLDESSIMYLDKTIAREAKTSRRVGCGRVGWWKTGWLACRARSRTESWNSR